MAMQRSMSRSRCKQGIQSATTQGIGEAISPGTWGVRVLPQQMHPIRATRPRKRGGRSRTDRDDKQCLRLRDIYR